MELVVGQVYLCEVWTLPRELDGVCQGNTSSLAILKYDGMIEDHSSRIYRCGDKEYEARTDGLVQMFVAAPGSGVCSGPVAEVVPLRVMQPDVPQPEKQEVEV